MASTKNISFLPSSIYVLFCIVLISGTIFYNLVFLGDSIQKLSWPITWPYLFSLYVQISQLFTLLKIYLRCWLTSSLFGQGLKHFASLTTMDRAHFSPHPKQLGLLLPVCLHIVMVIMDVKS